MQVKLLIFIKSISSTFLCLLLNQFDCVIPPPIKLVVMSLFDPTLGLTIGIRARTRSGGLERASRDQRGRWPFKEGRLLWTNTIARYGICPTSVVWATNVGFIYQMGSLANYTSLLG
ncbi:hypothetical protein Hanom_Chr07g00603191 [Helianthus anomalus]